MANNTPISVLASVTHGLTGFFSENGLDGHDILERCGIDLAMLDRPTAYISLEAYAGAFAHAAQISGNDNVGMRFGQGFPAESMGLIGYMWISAQTLEAALRSFTEFFPRHQSGTHLAIVDGGPLSRLEYAVPGLARSAGRRQDAELSIGMFMNMFRHAMGQDWSPEQIWFEHGAPSAWREHRDLLRADVRFGMPVNAIVFRSGERVARISTANTMLQQIIRENFSHLTHREAAAVELIDAVRHEIERSLPERQPTLADVAHKMGMPAWTLQRRLGREGRTFSRVLDTVRRDLALAYLREGRLNVSQVAYRLNYSEVAAFCRAFQRWVDMSPSEWQSRL
ncbi:AraC family transcriptional regulator [Komagataeibacter sp. FNDCF1]|uniref:AraC-like transcriptional regulator QhpR n=1 Tax=Komagataeibacter sp. FNDCF1 TaxID=2878681 RepID=UPI001E2E4905|nr:AraC family transcriptional regulator [Komagataeibacter sp. FNDCF1]MCE2565263.1 AraC family transcriptional regulator [Komagataeibacter sp. FNDCF1]